MASIDTATPTNHGQYACDNCGAEWPSPYAAVLCCDPDLEQ